AHGHPDGPRPRGDPAGGGPVWTDGPEHRPGPREEDGHGQRAGDEAADAARDPAGTGSARAAGAGGRGRRVGRGPVPVLPDAAGTEGGSMITKITGTLQRALEEEVRLQVGAFEYQVLVPECARRQLQTKVGQDVTLHTTEYLEGN